MPKIVSFNERGVLLSTGASLSYRVLQIGYRCTECGKVPVGSWNGQLRFMYPRCGCGVTRTVVSLDTLRQEEVDTALAMAHMPQEYRDLFGIDEPEDRPVDSKVDLSALLWGG